MTPTNYVEVAVALLVLLGAGFALYQYVRRHPEALAAFDTRLKAVEATAQTDLKAALSRIELALGMIHTAVQNPTQVVVTGTPMPLPPAVVPPVAPVVDAPPSAAAPAAKPFDPAAFEGTKAPPAGTVAAPTPAVFNPLTWGLAAGEHWDYTFEDATPKGFTSMIPAGKKVAMGCGSGYVTDATPLLQDALGNTLAKGYGAIVRTTVDTPVTFTCTPNKVPCQVSVGLMNA